ncbi:histone-lysine N-methyltransferase ASH1L [Trichonephila clavipes]|nr:histone-lysine N-methyltransferase ASH1L [Trichonephila clavipes]
MVSWEYLWPTLRCRWVAGVSSLLSIGWGYLSSVSPKRHCCRVSAADKGCRVYPLDPRPDAVALCSGCTPGKRRAWFLPDDRHTASLVGLRGGSLNSCRGVISEPDLLTTSESEILERFSDQGVIQVRRITIKKNTTVFPTKLLILTFNSLNLPTSIKAGYLNCKIRPYILNPLRCFKCQRFGHSQTSCHGQLTCSRCASVGHASTDCILEPKCINCSVAHSADSKLCPKWRIEKQIQEIKTSKNISYPEARKLIVPQTSQTYAQVAKTSTAAATTQTDAITKIVCPALKLLQPLRSVPKPTIIFSLVPAVLKSSTSTQALLLPSTSSVIVTSSSNSQPPIPLKNTAPSTANNLSTSAASSSSTISMSTSLSASPSQNTTTTSNTILSTSQDAKQTSKPPTLGSCAISQTLTHSLKKIELCHLERRNPGPSFKLMPWKYQTAFSRFVFRVPLYEIISLDSIVGLCCVLDLPTYCKGRPKGFKEGDVYICEYRVDKTAHLFYKISKIKYPVCTKKYAFDYFEKRRNPKRTFLPHTVPSAYRKKGDKGLSNDKKAHKSNGNQKEEKRKRGTHKDIDTRLEESPESVYAASLEFHLCSGSMSSPIASAMGYGTAA